MIDAPLSDRLILRFFPKFLYRGKWLQNITDISVSLYHQISPVEREWKFMDYLTLRKASVLKYRGTVKQLKLVGELDPKKLVFEVVKSFSDRTLTPGDIVMLEKKDLPSLSDAPQI